MKEVEKASCAYKNKEEYNVLPKLDHAQSVRSAQHLPKDWH